MTHPSDALLEEMLRMHGAALYARIHRYVRNAETAQDLRQEVFFSAAQALRRGERPESASSWLRTIATRKVIDHVRRANARPTIVDGLEEAATRPANATAPQADFEDDLARLPLIERTVALLAYQEGRSIEEIAGLMEAPSGTVKTWLARARSRLRPRFEDGRR